MKSLILVLLLSGCAYSTKSPDDRNYELVFCVFAKCNIDKSENKKTTCIGGSLNKPHEVDVPCQDFFTVLRTFLALSTTVTLPDGFSIVAVTSVGSTHETVTSTGLGS